MDYSSTRWEEFLNPDVLRPKLISASIYLAAFELLKDAIIERIETFFTDGYGPEGNVVSPEYEKEVLSIHKSRVRASLEWLKEQDAISDQDIDAFNSIRTCRNDVAHEMPKFLVGDVAVNFSQQFELMVTLLRKIEVWWIVNFEIPISPEFRDMEIDESGIVPGPLMTLQVMLDIALGDPEKASYYYDELRKRRSES
ncbi:hypothetical protein SAMN04488490_0920 [Marinobacter sp. LV10R510-11A]|uniref:hypothetical protein n=1 Tax=Marinobacter sp. LV10R510-11A TaxID=1415568 RepID=UPI000BB7E086|nr:hypothetical protein [Marinobacter sp. LV10R510-11A]SOB75340.1 hypothetical protein SAMN04488490_0920 [Marinobacter sp. LV10R510-11A]